MGWPIAQFWSSTPKEYLTAVDGHNRLHGNEHEPMSRRRLDELIAENPPSFSIKRQKRAPSVRDPSFSIRRKKSG